jgi:hypothetical protein
MHHVSLIIEFLRGRPAVVFWAVALTQAALWTLIPWLFYSAPPEGVPLLLAIGHEFMLGSYLGPPLAFWLGELVFRFAGLFGLYALSQVCIVTAMWAVFTLGRAVVGTRHAVLGILLMAGIAAFSVPSPDFGPAVLAAPLWALALLHYWRAVGQFQRGAWFLLALDLGLLMLTSYVGVLLLALLIVFSLGTARGRRAFLDPEPWFAIVLMAAVVFPFALWLYGARAFVLSELDIATAFAGSWSPGAWLMLTIAAVHLGFVLLIVLASGWPRKLRERAPEIDRPPVARLARVYVYFFALAPAALAVALAFTLNRLGPLAAAAPLVLLSGLAVIMAAGDRVHLYRERLVSSVWLGLLLAPPLLAAISLVAMPWIAGRDLRIAQPASAEAQFFAESYQRRTGKPLGFVTGDERIAPLIAMTAPSRPRVFFAWAPQRSPWVTVDDVAANGAVLVWPAETATTPPAALRTQFPGMVPELPRSFERAVQGRLPLIRLGWSVLRPQAP